MELRDYLRILHKNWLIVLACTILGLGVATTYAFLQQPKYTSTTQVYVSVRTEGAATGELVQGTNFARQIITSYVEIASTALVLQPVIDELDLDTSVAELARRVSANAPTNTVMIDITAVDTDPVQAARIADATATSLTDAVQNTLDTPADDAAASPVILKVVQPAAVAESPSSPNIPLFIVLGGLAGIALGIGIAVLRTVLDTRVRTVHDLEQLTDAPVLGGITYDPDASKRPLIVHADPRSPRSESFRSLRTNLQFLDVEGGPRAYVVSSAAPGEGKSTTTTNLAIALSETGARVALIDGDLRLPRVADYMSIEGGVGLSDVLIGRVDVADALQKWGPGLLYVLPSGAVPPNPSELLGSAAMDEVITALTEHFDYVLIDAPPLLLVTDAAVLSKKTRGVILVAASGKTKKQELAGAIRALQTAGGELLGLIATMLPTKGPDSYGYGAYAYGPTAVPAPAALTRAEAKKRAEEPVAVR